MYRYFSKLACPIPFVKVAYRVQCGFARVREGYTDGFTTDIRRIRGLTQIRERIHSGFTRVLTQCSQFTAVNPSMAFDKSLIVFPIYFMGDVVE